VVEGLPQETRGKIRARRDLDASSNLPRLVEARQRYHEWLKAPQNGRRGSNQAHHPLYTRNKRECGEQFGISPGTVQRISRPLEKAAPRCEACALSFALSGHSASQRLFLHGQVSCSPSGRPIALAERGNGVALTDCLIDVRDRKTRFLSRGELRNRASSHVGESIEAFIASS
jgi:hypothetical protein